MRQFTRSVFIVLVLLCVVASGVSAQATWKPTKPITVIVPWGAGGSTDQITRIAAGTGLPGAKRLHHL